MKYHQFLHDDMRPIPGFENYLINTKGDVYSLHSNAFLKPWKNKKGYLKLELRKNGKRNNCSVHRLVAVTFIPNPCNLPEVNHKDENKSNNHVDNLEWCSSKYNANYGTRNIRTVQNRKEKYGKEHHRAKQVRCINTGQVFDTVTQAEKWCGLWSGAVSACALGHKKTAGNHPITGEPLEWEYIDGSESVE